MTTDAILERARSVSRGIQGNYADREYPTEDMAALRAQGLPLLERLVKLFAETIRRYGGGNPLLDEPPPYPPSQGMAGWNVPRVSRRRSTPSADKKVKAQNL